MKRRKLIDIAKGLGIAMVVLGHNGSILFPIGNVFYRIIFSFHIPLFFFLSGAVFSTSYNLKTLIQKRCRGLLLPYFATAFFFISFNFILNSKFSIQFIIFILKTSIYASGLNLFWSPLWFLPCLFLTQLLFFILNKYILVHFNHIYYRCAIMATLLISNIYFVRHCMTWLTIRSLKNGPIGLPWSADFLLITSFYFFIGFEYKKASNTISVSTRFFIISLCTFIFCHIKFPYTIDLNLRRYDNIFISSLEAISGIVIVLFISQILTSIKRFNLIEKWFSYLGRRSLIIFIFHLFSYQLAGFFLSNYFSLNKNLFSIISFLFALVIPILLYEIVLIRVPLIGYLYSIKKDFR